jgi:hypothetical protein
MSVTPASARVPPLPRGLGPARAGYAPPLDLGNVLLGVALGLALAAALWWTGHLSSALVVFLAVGVGASCASFFPLERCWIGDDWILNERWRRPVVVQAGAITSIRLPCSEMGAAYLVIHSPRGSVVVDLDELFRRPALAGAALHVLDLAMLAGAQLDPDARTVVDALRARHH